MSTLLLIFQYLFFHLDTDTTQTKTVVKETTLIINKDTSTLISNSTPKISFVPYIVNFFIF